MIRSLALLVICSVAGCATSPERSGTALTLPHPMSPNSHVDQFYMAPDFRPQHYDLLIVAEPILAVPLPKGELTYTPWAVDLRTALAQAMQRAGLFSHVETEPPDDLEARKIATLESAITEMDPGSQFARWMFGEFGGGNSFLEVEGRIVDASTGVVLVQFADRRRGAAIFDIAGGDSQALLQEDLRGIAKGVASALGEAVGAP